MSVVSSLASETDLDAHLKATASILNSEECSQWIWKQIPEWLIARIEKAVIKLDLDHNAVAAQIHTTRVSAGELLIILGRNSREQTVKIDTILAYFRLLQLTFKDRNDGKHLFGYGSGSEIPVSTNTSLQHCF